MLFSASFKFPSVFIELLFCLMVSTWKCKRWHLCNWKQINHSKFEEELVVFKLEICGWPVLLQYYLGAKQVTTKWKDKKAQIGISCPTHRHKEICDKSEYVHITKYLLDTKHWKTPNQTVGNKVLRLKGHYMTPYGPYTKDSESYIGQYRKQIKLKHST